MVIKRPKNLSNQLHFCQFTHFHSVFSSYKNAKNTNTLNKRHAEFKPHLLFLCKSLTLNYCLHYLYLVHLLQSTPVEYKGYCVHP